MLVEPFFAYTSSYAILPSNFSLKTKIGNELFVCVDVAFLEFRVFKSRERARIILHCITNIQHIPVFPEIK